MFVSALIYLQQQFPGYTTDTKCRPAAKPSNIMTWVQKLQLPDRNSSFIKEQIYSKYTGQHLLPTPAAAGSTNKSFIFLVSKQQAQKVWGKTFHKGILSTESGWAESSSSAGKRGWEGSAAASVCRYWSPAVSMEVCFYGSLEKHRSLGSHAQFPAIQRTAGLQP